MATQSAVFSFSLPEDVDSDQLLIYQSDSKNGTYVLQATVSYEYGERTYEYDSLNDLKWYKIKFNNSIDNEAGPISDPVYGGSFSNASPFLAVSTTTDGAYYATTEDVYDYANLTPTDVSVSKISKALKRARSVIDLRTTELDLNRFDLYETEVARKKHNATLRIIRECEINIALGHLYRGLADDKIMERKRGTSGVNGQNISIGQTSLGSKTSDDLGNTAELNRIANRYLSIGAAMLAQLQPNTCRFTRELEISSSPKFRYPFNGYRY